MRIGQLGILLLPLLQHLGGSFQYPARLFAIDVVLICQTLCRAATNILVAEAAFHLVQDTFAQRAIGQTKFFDGQRVKHTAEDRQPRRKDRFTVF